MLLVHCGKISPTFPTKWFQIYLEQNITFLITFMSMFHSPPPCKKKTKLLLSTKYSDAGVNDDAKKKLYMITSYNKYKTSVDIMYQMVR